MTSIVVLAPDRAQAANVTKVNAPDLQRPPDGKVYPFTVAVSGTYNNAERTNPGEIIMTAWYLDGDQPIGWNPAIDQPIHKRNFLVPAYDPNTQANNWSVDVEFLVGCTT